MPCELSALEDLALMRRVKRGDQAAFAVLVARHQDYVLNLFMRRAVSFNDAQDLAEKTFLRLWNYRRRFVPTAKLTTFLYLLVQQVAMDYFRAETNRQALAHAAQHEVATGTAPFLPRPHEVPAISEERAAQVRQAVAQLPTAQRDVVELAVYNELPYAEVGAALGIPVGTVKSRMFNGLRKLKELLQ